MPAPPLVPGDLVRIRDERWTVARHTPGANASVLDVRGRDRTNLGARASFLLPFEVVEPLPSSQAPRLVRARTWRRRTRAWLAEATPSWEALRTPVRARISLLPFQLEPALAITRGVASRLLIADEVGLGKTVQAGLIICEILERRRHGRVLVVAPASLREQWQDELRARFGLDAWLADSSSLARLGAVWTPTFNPWSAHAVTITSIDFVKRPEVMRALEALVWDAVVFDEAHALTGRSDRTTAAGSLARRARTLVMLTATPHTGDEGAFDRFCRVGDLDGRFPLLVFRRTRQDVGLSASRRTTSLRVRPTPVEREMHRALMTYARRVWARTGPSAGSSRLAMTVLLRRACSSAASLHRSIERRLALLGGSDEAGTVQMALPLMETADDDEPGAELAAPGLDDAVEERGCLEHLLSLAQRARHGESKLRALVRLLRRARQPVIVFTEYRDTLSMLAAALHDLEPEMLHGGSTAAERADATRRFTSGSARVLLATDAASEGLNLQARCRLVVNLELPWTHLRLEQRIGRVERIGQSRRVHAVHLLAAGTTEESSVATLLLKMSRVAGALEPLRPRATEQQVAGVAIGHEAFDRPPESRGPSGPHILVPALQDAARVEALRLEKVRSLSGGSIDAQSDSRPPVAILRRRFGGRFCLWGFRLAFTDRNERLVWETLLGVALPSGGADPRTVMAWVESSDNLPETVLVREEQRALDRLATSLRGPLDLATRRERAIAAALTAERARLSAPLLQTGLFDRRAERARTAQNAVLEEALERCRRRAEEIAGAGRLVVEVRRLVFAVVRR